MGVVTCMRGAIVSGALALSIAAPAMSADFNWRIQSNLNPGSPGYVALEHFAEVAEEMSGGRISFEIFPVGALFPITEGLEAVGNGLIEMGVLTGAYYTGKIGPIGILETGVPGAIRTPTERYNLFYEYDFISLTREVFARHNIHYLAPQLSSPWDLVSTKPITSASDFEGLKVREFGLGAKWFESLGATPVFMGGGEIYTALATGTVDAVRWGSAAGNFNAGLHEVAKYYVQPSIMEAGNNFFGVNMDSWNSLPKDLQAILDQAGLASSMKYLSLAALEDAAALNKMVEGGVTITRISDEDWASMASSVSGLLDDYAKEDEDAARGVEILKKYLSDLGR